MKKTGIEFSNDFLYKALGFIIIVFITFMVGWEFLYRNTDKNKTNSYKLSLEHIYNSSYTGIVKYKDYDKSNHNNPNIYFTNGNSIIEGDFWSVIKKDDSLIKKKGEYIIRVYRNDSMFTLNQKKALQDYQKNKNRNLK